MAFNKALRHKLFISLALFLCLVFAMIILLPLAIQYSAQFWLRQQGLDAHIEYVGFNPVTGTLLVENARGQNGAGQGFSLQKLLIEINWKPLFAKQVAIQRFEIDGLAVDAGSDEKGIQQVAGIAVAAMQKTQAPAASPASAEPVSWSARLHQLELNDIKFCHTRSGGGKEQHNAALQQLLDACVSLAKLQWQGEIGWAAPARDKPALDGLRLDGNLLLQNFIHAAADGSRSYASLDKLAINEIQSGNMTRPADDRKQVAWSAGLQQLQLAGMKLCMPPVADQQPGEPLTAQQMLDACVSLASLQWQGELGWVAPLEGKSAASGLVARGDLLAQGLLHASPEGEQVYARLQKLAMPGIQVSGVEQLNSRLIELSNVDLLQLAKTGQQPATYLASWRSLKIDSPRMNLSQKQARIKAITLSGLDAHLENSKTGLAGLPANKTGTVTKTAKAAPEVQDQPVPTEAPLKFAINRIQVDGDSRIAIIDKTVEPVFNETLSAIRLSLAELDSAAAEADSLLSLEFKVGEYGEINIKGTVKPFADRLTMNLKQNIRNVDLAKLNVYGKTYIGHRIQGGHLNLEQKLVINQGILDTESKLELQKFEIESLQGAEADKYKSSLGIPLSTALSLLRNKDGSITLTIPVTGDIEAPDFSLNDVIAKVTSKAIKEAIISYYTPFGLVKLLGGAIDLATGLSFEPVVFAPGASELDQQAHAQLDKLAKLMQERPQIHLAFCGYPTRSDALSLYPADELGIRNSQTESPLKLTDKQASELLAIFSARMDNIKKYLVKQLEAEPGRLILCSEPQNQKWREGIEEQPAITITL
ncbi:MAG: DUF748 domain-containing protein [Thioalkalispiraceae bacterium]|jgi:hypothetical protein